MAELFLALDFGGTKHTAGLIEVGERSWRSHRRVRREPGASARADLLLMTGLAQSLLGDSQPAAVGASFGGPVEFQTGRVRLSHHVPGWSDFPLRDWLEEQFQAPACVDNDANAAAVGEWLYGAGRGYKSLLYVTVSTGVGGGWILDGRVWRGQDSMAGEIGHTVVDPQGPICLCGKKGCVERLASGPYMAEDVKAHLRQNPADGPEILRLTQGNWEALDARVVAQAAGEGDPLAVHFLERAGWAVGAGLANAANLLNPQLFILGGGVTKSGKIFWQKVRSTAQRLALPEVHFDIVPALLEDDSPLWGAVALAKSVLPAET